jgi:drug/metabolite transporter (DMT)-like permease
MAPLSDNARGAVFMMIGMAGFVCNDTLMKLVSQELTLFQAIFLRGLMACAMLALFALSRGALMPTLGPTDRRLLLLRMAAEIGGTTCFLTALFNMPIANATAILQSMPLAVTLGAALFLGEPVGWRRYAAIAVGFLGVLVIIQPGSEGFTIYALWAVGAIVFMVVRDLSTRRLTRDVPSIFVALTTGSGIMLFGGIAAAATGTWAPVTGHAMALLAAAAVFLLIGYVFNVLSMRHGEIGFVSPFRYTILIWAILLGAVVFGDRPSAAMLAGSAIVVGTGIYTLYRERQRARRALAARSVPGRGL